MAEEPKPFSKRVNSSKLKTLFGSFKVKIPDDPTYLSFVWEILNASKFDNFVTEIKSLSENVVLCKHLRNEDRRPGTVYVYEIDMKYKDSTVVIDEQDKQEWTSFFVDKKNKDIIKVILIHSRSMSVIEAKKIVHKRYKPRLCSELHYIQHVSEEYAEISKLSAHQKVMSYKRLVESIRESIPLEDIANIAKRAADRALSKENITRFCFDAVLQECGNVNSGPYACRSFVTTERLKRELLDKTLADISVYFGSAIFDGIKRHIASEVNRKFNPGEVYWEFDSHLFFSVNFVIPHIGKCVFESLKPFLSIIMVVRRAFFTLIFSVDVNSVDWRRNVANDIYEILTENGEDILKEITVNIEKGSKTTMDQLKSVCEQLEEFRKLIDVVDLETLNTEWNNREVIKDHEALENNKSIISYIAGRKNGIHIVKVFVKYYDPNAIGVFKENANIEIVTIAERIEQLSEKMKSISNCEKIKPAVEIAEKNRFGRVINDNAAYLCANHTNVVGLGISNVRCIDDNIIPQPCIVIYCLDKSIIPYGENKLPETIQGCPCDLREDMVMFGTSTECRYENPNPGCSVGMSFKHEFGSAGFLAKSNATLENPVTGFLTAAHVVIQELHKLYKAESLLSDCSAGEKKHIIVHPSWGHSANSQSIGEVVESYCGNYQAVGIDAAFVRNYKPAPVGQIPLRIANGSDFMDVKDTTVRKKGRASGETEGILVSDMSTVFVDDFKSPFKYQFDYCYEIKSKNANEKFFEPGDSGSGVYLLDRKGKKTPIGIGFAHRLDGTAYACRIEQITRAFNVSLYDVEETPMDTCTS